MPRAGMRRRAGAQVLLAAAAMVAVSGCGGVVLSPSGDVAEEVVDVEGVDELGVGGGFAVTAHRGDAAQMRLRADDNLLANLDVDVARSRATVGFDGWLVLGGGTPELRFEVPELRRLDASGGTRVDLGDGLTAAAFTASLSGGSRLQGQAHADEVTIRSSGGSRVDLDGEVEAVAIRVSGGGELDLTGLPAQRCEVDASGGSQVRLACAEALDVTASGGSDVHYDGDPTVSADLSGGSRVTP